ncbi:hypothetical protein EVAR_52607_1 [Eumeta japonica]|uniref:Uncharacterized protein n=1 Tax=Eumeta variegata TaxID=151549 RepID=A0A4C1YLB4_EUMVA|nr:hypothetical protein EVAR_52607_1 [Eumeta japonica]
MVASCVTVSSYKKLRVRLIRSDARRRVKKKTKALNTETDGRAADGARERRDSIGKKNGTKKLSTLTPGLPYSNRVLAVTKNKKKSQGFFRKIMSVSIRGLTFSRDVESFIEDSF